MTDDICSLHLPLSEAEARSLPLGRMVTVSGLLFTGRSRFHIRAVEQGLVPPLDYSTLNTFFHVGPVMRRDQGEWKVVSAEPTSSIRFERYSPEIVRRLKLRVLIGKTTMGRGTAEALKEVGGVHLTKIGLCGNALAGRVRKVHAVHFLEELGKTEATWVFEVERFGPFFVDMDAQGANYFEQQEAESLARLEAIERQLGIPAGYTFTSVRADGSREHPV